MRHKEIINQAAVYKRQRSNQVDVMFNTDIFTEKDLVIVICHNDGVEIKRASISVSKKSGKKLTKKSDNTFAVTLYKPYKLGLYDIEQIDGDTVFVPCLMLQ